MSGPSPQPHDSQTIVVVAFFIACFCVVYWRTAIRVIAIVLVGLAVYGMIAGMQGLHQLR
jgi:hypothetical protein